MPFQLFGPPLLPSRPQPLPGNDLAPHTVEQRVKVALDVAARMSSRVGSGTLDRVARCCDAKPDRVREAPGRWIWAAGRGLVSPAALPLGSGERAP